MKIKLFIWCIFFLPFLSLQAQITTEDFPRISIISGVDSVPLVINPEFRIPLESGNFLIIDPAHRGLILAVPEYPISRDFSEYIYPEGTLRILNLNQLPAEVIMRMGLGEVHQRYILKSFMLHQTDIDELKQLYLLSFQPLFDPVYSIRNLEGGVGTRFSAEHLLRQIFWKSERAKIHNSIYANAYKFYNLIPYE